MKQWKEARVGPVHKGGDKKITTDDPFPVMNKVLECGFITNCLTTYIAVYQQSGLLEDGLNRDLMWISTWLRQQTLHLHLNAVKFTSF